MCVGGHLENHLIGDVHGGSTKHLLHLHSVHVEAVTGYAVIASPSYAGILSHVFPSGPWLHAIHIRFSIPVKHHQPWPNLKHFYKDAIMPTSPQENALKMKSTSLTPPYTHTHPHSHPHAHTIHSHAHAHTCTYIHTHIHIVCTHTYTHIYIHTHANYYTLIHAHSHKYTCTNPIIHTYRHTRMT